MPLYASYCEEDGNVLKFSPLVAALKLTLSGAATIASIKVEAEASIAGTGSYQASKKALSLTKAVPFAVLNCTNRGSGINLSDGGEFMLLLAPGDYPGGLDLTICDMSHKKMSLHLDVEHLDADEYESLFGPVSEDGSRVSVGYSLAASTVDTIRRRAAALGISASAYLDQLVGKESK